MLQLLPPSIHQQKKFQSNKKYATTKYETEIYSILKLKEMFCDRAIKVDLIDVMREGRSFVFISRMWLFTGSCFLCHLRKLSLLLVKWKLKNICYEVKRRRGIYTDLLSMKCLWWQQNRLNLSWTLCHRKNHRMISIKIYFTIYTEVYSLCHQFVNSIEKMLIKKQF